MSDEYRITAYWGPRGEEPELLADRFSRTLEALGKTDPLLSGWLLGSSDSRQSAAAAGRSDIASFIRAGISRADDGTPTPVNGYYFWSVNGKTGTPEGVILRLHAGCSAETNSFTNTAHLQFAPLHPQNAALIEIRVIKPALLAMAASWDATWCGVRTVRMYDLEPSAAERRRPWFGLGWMTYLSARFAPMIAPPRSAITERPPGGGLLMIATEERFDVDNAEHMKVAWDIEAALAPVNALPWPPDRDA